MGHPRSQPVNAEPYRPSNGSEGEGFHAAFCDHCARDAAYRDGGPDADPSLGCKILADALCYSITDPEFPKEWIEDERGPRCTAFTTDPTMPARCNNTPDLFPESP